MSDLISRKAVLDALEESGHCYHFWIDIENIIESLPSARPTGEWINIDDEPYCKCSVCGTYIDDLDDYYSFCPFCGADNRGDDE